MNLFKRAAEAAHRKQSPIHYEKTPWDNIIYILIRYFAFLTASLVSAIFNLMLFQEMAPKDDLFLIFVLSSVSITLEVTKVTTIITANLFRDIHLKTKQKSAKVKQYIYFSFYFMLAMLSIIASVGFTFTLNEKMSSVNNIYLDQLEGFLSQVDNLKSQEITLNELEVETYSINIDNTKDIQQQTRNAQVEQTSSNSQTREAGILRSETLKVYEEFQDAQEVYNRIISIRQQEDIDEVALETALSEFEYHEDKLNVTENNFMSKFNIAKNEYDSANRDYNRLTNLFANTVSDINIATIDTESFNLEQLRQELQVQVDSLLISINAYFETEQTGVVVVSIDDANTKLAQRTKELKDNAGVSVMFREFGKLFNMDPERITLIILLFVSFLIELTIYQTSPDLKPTRKILYFFRNHIKDVDIQEMFKLFDEEEAKWNGTYKEVDPALESTFEQIVETPVTQKKKTTKKRVKKQLPLKKELQEKVEEIKEIEEPILEDAIVLSDLEKETVLNDMETDDILEAEVHPEPEVIEKIAEDIIEDNKEALIELEKPSHITSDKKAEEQPTFEYNFGRTTEFFMLKLKELLNGLFEGVDLTQKPYALNNVSETAAKINLSKRNTSVYLNRLFDMKYNGVPLIYFRNNKLYTSFDKDFLVEYTTKIVGK